MRAPPAKVAHRSLDHRRRRYSVREEALGRLWEHENVARRGISYGHGILQDLMFERRGPGLGPFANTVCRQIIRNRDAAIVATVVQWLGTNVGMCFLERALKMMGKRIEAIDPGPWTSWVKAAERLPLVSGRYLARERHHNYVSTSSAEVDFMVGVVPGKTGLWTSGFGYPSVVEWWYEPEKLND